MKLTLRWQLWGMKREIKMLESRIKLLKLVIKKILKENDRKRI